MQLRITNAQRVAPVSLARMRALARCAARRLGIRAAGEIAITFIDSRRMRALNHRFKGHQAVTDVLTFRYDGPPASAPQRQVIGEILIAPQQARLYARRHGISYTVELSRYVVHGLLHWLGYDDRTHAQQRTMRAREDRLLAHCAGHRSRT